MPISHFLLALTVVVVWGINFLFISLGLKEISPLLLCALRFFLASVPAIFFIKPPSVPFKIVALYGSVMFALQFALLFLGMKAGMPPGMASLLMQVQVFFSMFFAAMILGETPYAWQIIGACIAFGGISIVAMHADANISLLGFVLILAAAATWGVGNLITKKYHHVNMIGLIVWGSFVACAPMFLLSLFFEGPSAMVYTYHHITWVGVIALLYIVYGSTWVGYGVWNWLLIRYPIGTIVPFTLLVPIVGIISSIIILDEPFYFWKGLAGLLVLGGLGVNLLGARLFVSVAKEPPHP